jgi:AcrR family transcriptional regulator
MTDRSVIQMRAPRRTKRQVVAEFRNAGILEAARHVFSVSGFQGASMDEIARKAGVAKGTVYLYYASKEEIDRATLRRDLIALGDEIERRMAEAGSPREKVAAFIETKLAFFERNRDFFRLYQAAFTLTRPIHCHNDFRALYRRQIELLETAFRSGRAKDKLRRLEPARAAVAVFDLTRGVVQRRVFGRSRAATKQDLTFLTHMIWKGLSAR